MTQPTLANQALSQSIHLSGSTPLAQSLPESLSARLLEVAHQHPLLVALDFDGVVAPLGDDPAAVTPLPETVAAIQRLVAHGIPVAVVSGRDLALMTRQLAVLLRAGMPLVEALSALIDQTSRMRLRAVIYEVREKVNSGRSLGDARRCKAARKTGTADPRAGRSWHHDAGVRIRA